MSMKASAEECMAVLEQVQKILADTQSVEKAQAYLREIIPNLKGGGTISTDGGRTWHAPLFAIAGEQTGRGV